MHPKYLVKQFLSAFFEALNKNDIHYVVLWNIENIYDVSGKDIDILLDEKDIPKTFDIIKKLCHQKKALVLFYDSFSYWHHVHLFIQASNFAALILLDLKVKNAYQNLEYFPSQWMFSSRIKWKNIYRPLPAHEAVCLLLRIILEKKKFSSHYFTKIRSLLKENSQAFWECLRSILPDEQSRRLIKYLEEERSQEVIASRSQILTIFKARSLTNHLKYISWHIQRFIRLCKFTFMRRGALIVVLGPDGVGKSALITELVNQMESLSLKTKQVYFGIRGALLPTKRLMRYLRERKREKVQHSSRISENAHTRAQKKWSYFWGNMHNYADQLLRYWVYVRPALARRRVVFTDRYIYDAVTGPIPIKLYPVMMALLKYLVPRPDLTIVLYDTPENIYARKQELSLEEIKRQQHCYKKLAQIVPEIAWIPVSGTSKDMASQTLGTIMKAIAKRNAKQFLA